MKKIILASKSPDRSEILKRAGISFQIFLTQVNEDKYKSRISDSIKLVEELAKQKALHAKKVIHSLEDEYIFIGADTIVEYQGEIIGKPSNEQDAFEMLRKLQGSKHSLITGIALTESSSPKISIDHDVTTVQLLPLTDDELWEYIKSGEWQGRAGAYSLNDRAALFVDRIIGSSSNVIGLPLHKVFHILKQDFNLNLLQYH